MKVTVFTSNQPRHLALIESLASVAETVYAVLECNTVFPGRVADFFPKSKVMQDYFTCVIDAEKRVFGIPRFSSSNVRTLSIKMGDLNLLGPEPLRQALGSDMFVVFGASYIKAPLVDVLTEKKAINLHMGVSPYYRGSSCNFWALYDNRPDLVGATVHVLTQGLDSGPMLFHALPKAKATDPFVLGMEAVRTAHEGLLSYLAKGQFPEHTAVLQDRSKEIRYTRKADFTDQVVKEYLNRVLSPHEIEAKLAARDLGRFVNPYVAVQ
jgi:folate-dependent phosphoribosylglycinamide formyltransferase PurN